MKYTLKTRRPKVEVKCEICGKIFLRHLCNLKYKRIFCSQDCANKREKSNSKLLVLCSWCNQPIQRWPYQKSKNHFCSSVCFGKWNSVNRIKENSANWRGGIWYNRISILLLSKYRKLRRMVIDMDKKCVICNSNNRLEVHHILERREYPQLALDITNMITLCKSCHCKIHYKENLWVGYFSDIVAKRANSVDSKAKAMTIPSQTSQEEVCRDYIPSPKGMI
jgi:5-methylcytosine-specific restriction endonuclease McrA